MIAATVIVEVVPAFLTRARHAINRVAFSPTANVATRPPVP